jgi:hypothetical protein
MVVAKVTPIFKSALKLKLKTTGQLQINVEPQRFLKKLILKQINYLEIVNKPDFTCKQQHIFKKTKSTATACLLPEFIIFHSTDTENYALVASFSLSAASKLENVRLLIKEMRVIGLPMDLIKTIEAWLTDSKLYVNLNGYTSQIYDWDDGTNQCSVLGPSL